MNKKLLIPVFLAAIALPVCLNKGISANDADWISNYGKGDKEQYIKYASKIQDQLAEEGFVLLKNQDKFLPMSAKDANGNAKKITLAGKSSNNLAKGGAGSGASSVSSGVDDYQMLTDKGSNYEVKGSLDEVGFDVNKTLQDFYGKWHRGNQGNEYQNDTKSGPGRANGNDGYQGNSQVQIGETPLSKYTAEVLASLDTYNAAAIQVITREGSEGCDVKTIDARDFDPCSGNLSGVTADDISTRHALQLSKNEEDLFEELKKHTDNIIIIINSSNIFECEKFQNDPKVKAILWVGNPGDRGPRAIGRILTGAVNPSGRTVDTWGRDFREDPTFQNFSDNAQTNDQIIEVTVNKVKKQTNATQDTMLTADGKPMRSYGTDQNYTDPKNPRWVDANANVVQGGINGVRPASYVSYEEGIYVDYRYYETKYADMAAKDKAAADDWYNSKKGVLYPFGYGLSYTTFEQKIVKTNFKKGGKINEKNEVLAVTVEVTNTGTVAGKDAVQLYWKAPYKKGGIEKADHVLCAFGKTGMLEPGKSEKVELSFYLQDVANYDYSDANKNKFSGYELEKGKYALMLNKNAHENYEEIDLQVSKNIKYKNDRFTNNEVKNRFTDRGLYSSMPGKNDIEFTQMSRADFDGTFPTHPTVEDRKVKAGSKYEEFLTHEFTLAEFEAGNNDYVPAAARKTADDAANWKQGSKDTNYKVADLKDADFDDPRWEDLVNQMSWDDMLKVIETNKMSGQEISSIGKAGMSEGDGPQKFNIMQWVSSPIIAATFNQDLAHKQGECIGMESQISNKSGWWGPGVNTHRSPFGGRNFEYYSADPFLMGRMAAQVVGAATDRGVYAYFKHFAVNDQEKNRESGISFVNEQALREIYLKSFQMVFEEGKSIGVMSSYNRLGLMETAASYPLLTEVLRGEWGFKGAVLSDMTHSGNSSINFKCYENVNNRVLSGCNAQLDSRGFGGKSDAKWDNTNQAPLYTKEDGSKDISYSYWYAVRKCCREHMYMASRATGTMGDNRTQAKELGEAYETFEARTDFSYNVVINGAASIRLNQRVELPKGVKFENGVLSGKFQNEGVYHLDFIGEDASGNTVGAFKLVVTASTGNEQNFVKGCGGDVAAVGAIVGFIALAGAGLMLVSLRKKKRA